MTLAYLSWFLPRAPHTLAFMLEESCVDGSPGTIARSIVEGPFVDGCHFGIDVTWFYVRRGPDEDASRLLFCSDLHAGMWGWMRRVKRLRHLLESLSPDHLVVAGDLVDRSSKYLDRVLRALGAPDSPFSIDVVRGNHDASALNPCEWQSTLERHGVRDLARYPRHLTDSLVLTGLDHQARRGPAIPYTHDNPVNSRLQHLVVTHNPRDLLAIEEASASVVLAVAGHTHGGQIRLPGLSGRVRPEEYPRGPMAGVTHRWTCLSYIMRGIGVTGLPLRIRCPPEVVVVDLVR